MRLSHILAGAVAALSLAVPALAQETVAIVGGRILTGNSVIENGTVVIRDGKIVSVGSGGAPSGARVIDAAGKTVAPGFVAVDSGLAGTEVGSVSGTNELRNSANTLSAAFDISYGLDPWSFTLPVARLGGITRAIVVPQHPGSSGGHVHEDETAGAGDRGALFDSQSGPILRDRGSIGSLPGVIEDLI